MSKNLFIIGGKPIFGDLTSEEPSEIHGISAIVSALKDTTKPLSFTDCVLLYKTFSEQRKYAQDVVRNLIASNIIERKTQKGKIKLIDLSAAEILYLPLMSQPAIQSEYKIHLATQDMKVFNIGAFNVPAKSKYNSYDHCDSLLIVEKHKFPETYADIILGNGITTDCNTFDCLVTSTASSGIPQTTLTNINVYQMSGYLRRRLFIDENPWHGRYQTDPENPEPYMDIVVPNS